MRTLTLSTALLALVACGGTQTTTTPTQTEAPTEKKEEMAKKEEAEKMEEKAEDKEEMAAGGVEVGKDDGGEYPEVVVESKGNEMAYKQESITLKANTKTRIIMKNNATSDAMKHNVVIVKKGHEDEVGQAGVGVGPSGNYVPADNPNVLAATEIADPGESTTVVVDLPAGEYSFICTFPGHYVLMRGTVVVEE